MIRNTILQILLVLTILSCKSFVEVKPPKSQLQGNLVFEEAGSAEAAIAGVYMQLRDASAGVLNTDLNGLPSFLGVYVDELDYWTNLESDKLKFYTHTILASNNTVQNIWINTYNQIYNINAIVEGLDGSSKLASNVRLQLKGEALFMRALLHFYLLNLFGEIPYVDSTSYLVNSSRSRERTSVIYSRIIEDLKSAEEIIGINYPSAERVRANRSVVRFLLARAYLYVGNWKLAEETATAVIEYTSLYNWVEDLKLEFLKDSRAAIWALKPKNNGENGKDASANILLGRPTVSSLSETIVSSFKSDDLRRIHWIGTFIEGDQKWFYSYKYKERNLPGQSVAKEYTIVFRLSELYLIRAEARARLKNFLGAQDDLNKIRNRAGLENTLASGETALVDAILDERKFELFNEFGHRWFDLKRMGKAPEVLSRIKPNWRDSDTLLPIPEKEILVNPKLLPQNNGYE